MSRWRTTTNAEVSEGAEVSGKRLVFEKLSSEILGDLPTCASPTNVWSRPMKEGGIRRVLNRQPDLSSPPPLSALRFCSSAR